MKINNVCRLYWPVLLGMAFAWCAQAGAPVGEAEIIQLVGRETPAAMEREEAVAAQGADEGVKVHQGETEVEDGFSGQLREDVYQEVGDPPFLDSLFARDGAGDFFEGNEAVQGYLVEAGENHPRLRSLHEQWQAALKRIPQATSLDDPMFSYKQFLRSDMTQYSVMLGQQFPWFGVLALRGELAAAAAEARRSEMYAVRDEVKWRVKDAYYQLAFLANQLAVVEAQLTLIDYTEEVVRVRYGLGIAMQDELLRIQMEQSRIQDLRAEIMQRKAPYAAALNEALGRPLEEAAPLPEATVTPPWPPGAPQLATLIRERNPIILARDAMREEEQKGVALAERKAYPNITVQLEYMNSREAGRMSGDPLMPGQLMSYRSLARSATGAAPFSPGGAALDTYNLLYKEPMARNRDDFSVSLSVNVPIWRKRIKSEIEEARHRVRAVALEQQAQAREIEREAHQMRFEMEDAFRRLALYQDDLIPKAQQTFESLLGAYAGGGFRGGFIDVLDSVTRLLDFELEQVRAARDLNLAAARLEYLLAGPWEETEPGEAQ